MQNFGKIKNAFNNLLVEWIVKKDEPTKKLFGAYLRAIKESDVLKTQFFVFNNIENRTDKNGLSANLYVTENVKLMEKYTKEDILKANKSLLKLLKNTPVDLTEDYKFSKLHESLSKLIFLKRSPQNVDIITEEIKKVGTHIRLNGVKELSESVEPIDMPMSFITNLMVEKYNEKYNHLDSFDKEILRVSMDSNFENKKELYTSMVNECIGLVDGLVGEFNGESKEKLLKVKEKLLEGCLTENDDFISKISKLVDLKSQIK